MDKRLHQEVQTPPSGSPDGGTLASGGFDPLIRLWDVKRQRQIGELQGHAAAVNGLSFSPNGQILASASDDQTVRLWNIEDEEEIVILQGHINWVGPIVYSPDGEILASGGGDNTVRFWDVEKQEQIETFERHLDGVRAITFSRNGRWFASGGEDGTLLLWKVNFPSPYPVELREKLPVTLGRLKRDALLQNYPNPFNPETWIPYSLSEDASVVIRIFDAQGTPIRQLDLGQNRSGVYFTKDSAAYWDGRNTRGQSVAAESISIVLIPRCSRQPAACF